MVKFCVLLRTSFSKTQMFVLKKNMKVKSDHRSKFFFTQILLYDCFVIDSSRLHLIFETVCLCLSLIRKNNS